MPCIRRQQSEHLGISRRGDPVIAENGGPEGRITRGTLVMVFYTKGREIESDSRMQLQASGTKGKGNETCIAEAATRKRRRKTRVKEYNKVYYMRREKRIETVIYIYNKRGLNTSAPCTMSKRRATQLHFISSEFSIGVLLYKILESVESLSLPQSRRL